MFQALPKARNYPVDQRATQKSPQPLSGGHWRRPLRVAIPPRRRFWLACLLACISQASFAHFNASNKILTHLRQDAVPYITMHAARLTPVPGFELRRLLNAVVSTAVASGAGADPAQVGLWSGVEDWPVVAIHAALLPNGKVLAYDSVGDNPTESYDVHATTRVTVWDPISRSHSRVDNDTGYNLFCSGLAHLPDGREFLAGGNLDNQLSGIDATHVFDFATNSWTFEQHMAQGGRWYPSVTPLANGEMLITSGTRTSGDYVAIPEVRQADRAGTLRSLDNASRTLPWYPWMELKADGSVAYLGPDEPMQTLVTDGAGGWGDAVSRDATDRTYGSHAMYDIGKVLISGGGDSERSAVVVDVNTLQTTVASAMIHRRRQHNLTVLADGSVLATGGNSSGANLIDKASSVYPAERWDPDSGTWAELASMARHRQYHSIALLLPDARVLSAGGGVCGLCASADYLERNAEIFSPPYLFKHDGSHEPAPRPTITHAPELLNYDSLFTVTTPEAGTLRKAALLRLASVTHSVNFEQRYIPLTFTAGSGGLRLRSPTGPTIAPPGHYMLFLIDAQGVPSVASILRLDAQAPAQPDAPPTVVNPGPISSPTSTALNQPISANDPDAGPLQFSATGLPPGLSIDPQTGSISGQPQQAGQYPVSVVVTDDLGSRTTVSFDWTIADPVPPQPPVVHNPGNQTSSLGTTVRLPVDASAANGGALLFAATGLPPGLSIDPDSGLITGTPAAEGSYPVSLQASDSHAGVTTVQFQWLVTAAEKPVQADTGLVYEYYEGAWQRLPNFNKLLPAAAGIAKNINLAPRRRNERFALRYSGRIRLSAAGNYTFHLTADNPSRLWLDATLLLQQTTRQDPAERSVTVALGAGLHDLVLEYAAFDSARQLRLNLSGPGLSKQPVPHAMLLQPTAVLAYEYYTGRWSALPNFATLTPVKRGFVSLLDLAPSPRKANFALRFQGRLKIPTTDRYTFYLEANTGARVWLDGKPLVSRTPRDADEKRGSRRLTAGEHDLTVGYYSNSTSNKLKLAFGSRSIPKQALSFAAFPAE